ncbi:MAG: DUF433 domain-containing protein [Actinomycetota bacterium]|nr:DUF433 domain-containing protein [Actinomycetota bacterium]
MSERRIRYWDKTGVLVPSLAQGSRRSAFSRIYTFRDLVGLRSLGQLRDRYRFSLQQLRQIGEMLAARFDAPWASLRFYVVGRDIQFIDPETHLRMSTRYPGQSVIHFEVDLAAVTRQTEEEAAKLTERGEEDWGEIVRHRHVLGNKPVLAGTRIPTAAIWDFHRAGYTADDILQEYPRLTTLDVERAIAYEKRQRKVA